MKKKKVFLHMGLPKCASTSLQFSLSKCKEIDYVGLLKDPKSKKLWKNSKFSTLFDRVLRFSCKDELFWKEAINSYIEKSNKNTIFFSSESITLRFLPWDLPLHIKLSFIKKIFPKDTQFIYLTKNSEDMLLSIYKEWVLNGYRKKFDLFSNELYLYRDISCFNEILSGYFLKAFSEKFDLNKLNIINLNNKDMVSSVESILNLNLKKMDSYLNKSMTNKETDIIRQFNLNNNDSDLFFDSIELHRAYPELKDDSIKYALARKRRLRKSSDVLSSSIPNNSNNYTLSNEIKKYLLKDEKIAKVLLNNIKNYDNIKYMGKVLSKK